MSQELDPEQYPKGKMSEDDDGALDMLIGIENGNVKLLFKKPVHWIAMPPEQAIELGRMIMEHGERLQSVAESGG